MMGEGETRHWTTQEALDALQLLINGQHRLHVPPQATDADVVLGDVIDERDRLQAREAALVAALSALVGEHDDGWYFHERSAAYECLYCCAAMPEESEAHERATAHEAACPIVRGRAALVAAPATAGEGER